jgi:hypothetical protein
MDHNQIVDYLKEATIPPSNNTPEFLDWLKSTDFIEFLKYSTEETIPLYISGSYFYIYSVCLPRNKLKGEYIHDLMHWDARPDSTWGYGTTYKDGKPSRHKIFPPFQGKILQHAQPLTFLRYFEEKKYQDCYIELLQQLIHLLGLHYVDERSSYCKLNEDGDIDDVIKIHNKKDQIIVSIQKKVLDFYLYLTKSIIIRLYDLIRSYKVDFPMLNDSRSEDKIMLDKEEIYSRFVTVNDSKGNPHLSLLRGFQIIRNRKKNWKNLIGHKKKKYETFIAFDWKNNKIAEFSCDPSKLANYFITSEKPFETTPAFFKPEVLLKYKQDPEKYTLQERSISCRNSWYLKTYDINEEGQVHTYLTYLSMLPYSEQKYWKSFNEKPKSNISKRAIQTDFKADWSFSYNPLYELKKNLANFPSVNIVSSVEKIWEMPSGENMIYYDQLNYVVSNSKKEWQDEILNLAKILIEGFNNKYLKKLSKHLNCYNSEYGSIKILEECLKVKRVDVEIINNIISPLKTLQSLRSKEVVHLRTSDIKNITKKFVSLKEHFRHILSQCEKSINALSEIVKSKTLDIT